MDDIKNDSEVIDWLIDIGRSNGKCAQVANFLLSVMPNSPDAEEEDYFDCELQDDQNTHAPSLNNAKFSGSIACLQKTPHDPFNNEDLEFELEFNFKWRPGIYFKKSVISSLSDPKILTELAK